MTGFGSAHSTLTEESITVEIKTLNSKFLDLSYKASRLLSAKEIDIRNIITQELVRGKISFSIQIEKNRQDQVELNINQELFSYYLEQYKKLEDIAGRQFNDILKLAYDSPDVLKSKEDVLNEESWNHIHQTIQAAIKDCNRSREEEGEKLSNVLSSYIEAIRSALQEIIKIEPDRLVRIKERLRTQVNELITGKEFDEDRLEQELIYYSEKLDINEEIERLSIHLNSYQEVLKNTKESQHGKKLGFISQEIGREINTIGSKANDAAIQKYVIQMKEELEKIKEQTLNIL